MHITVSTLILAQRQHKQMQAQFTAALHFMNYCMEPIIESSLARRLTISSQRNYHHIDVAPSNEITLLRRLK